MNNKSCIAYAQKWFTTNDHNKLKVIRIERDLNEHNNYVIQHIIAS